MVVIPSGSFLMGSSVEDTAEVLKSMPSWETGVDRASLATEHPQHAVTIARPFALGKYPVTRGEFAAFVRETGYSASGGCTLFANHKYLRRPESDWQNPGLAQTNRDPVVCVNWQDAKAYIAWLNKKLQLADTGASYRLPSEAEWEYAARAGTRTARWWGDAIGYNRANCDGCGSQWDKKQTAPVGSFSLSPFGLSDMLGNVWQWTEDCWNVNYARAPEDGAAWTIGTCESRSARGGSWTNLPWVLRCSKRTGVPSARRFNFIGFRVAKGLQ